MFTGIITDIGTIKSIKTGGSTEWGDLTIGIETAFDMNTVDICFDCLFRGLFNGCKQKKKAILKPMCQTKQLQKQQLAIG